jgi:hypothetical protein
MPNCLGTEWLFAASVATSVILVEGLGKPVSYRGFPVPLRG